MVRNPCRNCESSYEYKGRHYKSLDDKCAKCEKIKAHEKYLQSQREYVSGEPISNFAELVTYEFVMWHGKVTHIEVIKHLQYSTIIKLLNSGAFKQAIKKEVGK